MSRNWRLVTYGVVAAALLIASLAEPAAWARPGQSVAAQTIPTKTPPPPPVQPTEPPANDTPVPTSAVATSVAPTSVAPGTVQPVQPAGSTATCLSTAGLTLASDRKTVWPGATVVFTTTLSNTGRQPLTQVVLEAQLSAGLDPVGVLSGGGTWHGRTLRVAAPSLGPGSRLAVVYSARVAATSTAQAVTAGAVATSAGCARKIANVTLGMPPSQLPATGGRLD
jgi:uncharacterized repeat protein (TIGR01451 family)